MDDSQGILATVYRLAPVGVKLCLNIDIWEKFAGPELSIATFADADCRKGLLYDPQFALLHDCSLAHSVERHHYRDLGLFDEAQFRGVSR